MRHSRAASKSPQAGNLLSIQEQFPDGDEGRQGHFCTVQVFYRKEAMHPDLAKLGVAGCRGLHLTKETVRALATAGVETLVRRVPF